MSSRDALARRTAVQREMTAVAARYESDTAPQAPGERHTGIIEAHDCLVLSDETDLQYALLELAGRCQAWLEHLAMTEAP